MIDCEQTPGLNVLAHGQSVWSYYQDLFQHCVHGQALNHTWRLPEWVYDPRLWNAQHSLSVMEEYAVHHDCGKPYCRLVDDEGRVHFPDHASWSEKVWRVVGGSNEAARLMAMDMDIHTLKAEGLDAFSQTPEWASLVIMGLCEVHSNAAMFGGLDSSSFKMKWKQINRRGKGLLKLKD